VLYFFDRFSASKLGQPLTVRDEDIDVEMPSMDGLSKEEAAEFQDPSSLIINIKLGRIVGNICKHELLAFSKSSSDVYSDANLRNPQSHKRALHPPSAQHPKTAPNLARRTSL
jgi:hypothetical protein